MGWRFRRSIRILPGIRLTARGWLWIVLFVIVAGALAGKAVYSAELAPIKHQDQRAIDPFGFRFGTSQTQVENAVSVQGLGVASWIGRTLRVQAADNSRSYLFNFCKDSLVEVSGSFQENFEQMASIVETSVKAYGQPWYVSAEGAMTDAGFLRPINLYWKMDESTFMRLMQMPHSYTVVYQVKNSCGKVPT
jgi:hypothetical protein